MAARVRVAFSPTSSSSSSSASLSFQSRGRMGRTVISARGAPGTATQWRHPRARCEGRRGAEHIRRQRVRWGGRVNLPPPFHTFGAKPAAEFTAMTAAASVGTGERPTQYERYRRRVDRGEQGGGGSRLEASQLDALISAMLPRGKVERRRLIVFSKQWPMIREQVYERIEARARGEAEATPGSDSDDTVSTREEAAGESLSLLRLVRELRELDEEMAAHADLLERVLDAHADGSRGKNDQVSDIITAMPAGALASAGTALESLVLLRRSELRQEFFSYCGDRIAAAHAERAADGGDAGQPDGDSESGTAPTKDAEVDTLVSAVARTIALCKAHDAMAVEADAAKAKVDKVLSMQTLEEADSAIDMMAANNELDPATVMTFAKAYAGAKETDMTSEECTDTLYHLYLRARNHMQEQQPAPLRILQYLLYLEDPVEVQQGLDDAFSSGPVDEKDENLDYLSTTPMELIDTIDKVILAFKANNADLMPTNLVTGSMRDLLNIELIDKMKELKQTIELRYL